MHPSRKMLMLMCATTTQAGKGWVFGLPNCGCRLCKPAMLARGQATAQLSSSRGLGM
jgi:hypothetical protein